MRRVLACVDLSESSDLVVGCARDLTLPDGELVVFHVGAPDPDFVGYAAGPGHVRDTVAAELRDEHRALARLVDGARREGIGVTPLMVQGATAEKILEHAGRLRSDLVVVGSRGHGALHDLLVGSVVRELLRAAKVPVVVVPVATTR